MITNTLAAAITFVFLVILLSYYVLLIIRKKVHKPEKIFSSLTVIIPALNEEKYIREAIESVLRAKFDGKKEIIVVNDGSTDRTKEIASSYINKGIILINNKEHMGKSYSLNKALKVAKGEAVAVVDGDCYLHKDSLQKAIDELGRKNVVAACGVVKVRNHNKFICLWLNIELLYNSLIRNLFSKVNANVVTPGAYSIYRKKALLESGGFSTEGFSEDVTVAIRLIRNGGKITFAEEAVSEANMPYTIKGFFRQRIRLARGMINLLKRNLRLNNAMIDVYTLPLFLFTYMQAIIMGALTLYNIFSGYIVYFASRGVFMNLNVLKFFFEWFSIVGFVKWTVNVFSGLAPLNFLSILGIFSTFLSYPLFIYAIIKYEKKIGLRHLIPIFFMFPYWLVIMVIYIICMPEIFRKKQYNIWDKSE